MAAIRQKADVLVVLSGDRFLVIQDGNEFEIKLPEAPIDEKKQQKRDDRTDVNNKNCALASGFSPSGKYFAVGDDNKQLHVYKVLPTEWELMSTRPCVRRFTALSFSHSETAIVASDRSGDVYQYSVQQPQTDGQLILGHLSMILDVTVTDDDKYILTCDRDEKVRISHYPGAYNIHTYCLGHTEYVSQVLYVDRYRCIISGGGDGKIATWSLDGKLHNFVYNGSDNNGHVTDDKVEGQEECRDEGEGNHLCVKKMVYDKPCNLLAVIFYNSKLLKFYTLQKSENHCIQITQAADKITLPEDPWDICFDTGSRLWTVSQVEHEPVQVFTCTRQDDGKVQISPSCSDGTVQQTIKLLSSKWDFFKASLDCTSQLNLQKMRTNENVQRYLEKKEERISGQKIKFDQPPLEKKIKTS